MRQLDLAGGAAQHYEDFTDRRQSQVQWPEALLRQPQGDAQSDNEAAVVGG